MRKVETGKYRGGGRGEGGRKCKGTRGYEKTGTTGYVTERTQGGHCADKITTKKGVEGRPKVGKCLCKERGWTCAK